MITWNIDGLDDENLMEKTTKVIETIEEVRANNVFLQEVIPVILLQNRKDTF